MAAGMPAAVCVLDPTQDRSVPSSATGSGVVWPHCPVGCGVDPWGTAALQRAGCLCILSSPSLQVSPASPLEPGACPLFSAVLILIPHWSLPCEALTAFKLGRRCIILCPEARPGRPGMRETSVRSNAHTHPGWWKGSCSSHRETEAGGGMQLELSRESHEHSQRWWHERQKTSSRWGTDISLGPPGDLQGVSRQEQRAGRGT